MRGYLLNEQQSLFRSMIFSVSLHLLAYAIFTQNHKIVAMKIDEKQHSDYHNIVQSSVEPLPLVNAQSIPYDVLQEELAALDSRELTYQREHQKKIKSLEKEFTDLKKKHSTDLVKIKQQTEQLKKKKEEIQTQLKSDKKTQQQLKNELAKVSQELDKMDKLHDMKKEIFEESLKTDEHLLKSYRAKLSYHMSLHWKIPSSLEQSLKCILDVAIIPNGQVRHVQLLSSSGSKAFDDAAIQAVYKASPLPYIEELTPAQRPKKLTMTFVPEHITASEN